MKNKKDRNFKKEEQLHQYCLSQIAKINDRNKSIGLYYFDGGYGRLSLHRVLQDNNVSQKAYYCSFLNTLVLTDRSLVLRIALAIEVPQADLQWFFSMAGHAFPYSLREESIYKNYPTCGYDLENLNFLLEKDGFEPIPVPEEKTEENDSELTSIPREKKDRNRSRS